MNDHQFDIIYILAPLVIRRLAKRKSPTGRPVTVREYPRFHVTKKENDGCLSMKK